MTGAPKQAVCQRGHLMQMTRRFYANGESYCRDCKKIRYDIYRKAHPDRTSAYHRKSFLRRSYGMETDEYEALLGKQGGGCAICKSSRGARRLHVDHDHDSGVIRGLLCHGCNTAIGLLKEDPSLIEAALLYLEKAGKSKKKK